MLVAMPCSARSAVFPPNPPHPSPEDVDRTPADVLHRTEWARTAKHARPHRSLLSLDRGDGFQHAIHQMHQLATTCDQGLRWGDSAEAARHRAERDSLGRDRQRQIAERDLDNRAREAYAKRARDRQLAEKAEQEAERKRLRRQIQEDCLARKGKG